jgi:hypothetical protein
MTLNEGQMKDEEVGGKRYAKLEDIPQHGGRLLTVDMVCARPAGEPMPDKQAGGSSSYSEGKG